MKAVIKTGGKQYLVWPGAKIKIEKLKGKEGEKVEFSDVLLVEKDGKVKIGAPFVEGAKVIGEILAQQKGEKIVVLKYKKKRRYRIKRGHRQPFTQVEIKKIEIKKPAL